MKALHSAHSAQSHQLTQALAKVQDLTGQLAEQETKFANEASGLKRLVSMMEEREKQAKEIVENLENEWAGVGQKAELREAALKDEIEKERRGREEAEKRLKNLEAVIEGMGRGDLPIPGRASLPGTPLRTPGTPGDPFNDGMLGLSPTVAIASRTQKSGKTFTEVYTDYVKLKEDYAKKVIEYDNMDRTLQSVLAQIQERVGCHDHFRFHIISPFSPGAHPFATTGRVLSSTNRGLRARQATIASHRRTRCPSQPRSGNVTEVQQGHLREQASSTTVRRPWTTSSKSPPRNRAPR